MPLELSGELKQWHKITLTLDGPESSETGTPNPFVDYRLQVVFKHPESGLTYNVPGYFAADGNAANTSATSGNKWRAHLAPDHPGEWTYKVSFRTGPGIAVSDDPIAGEAVKGLDGLIGSFDSLRNWPVRGAWTPGPRKASISAARLSVATFCSCGWAISPW